MSYEAIIGRVTTRPHTNADNLQLGLVAGHQVIVGKDVEDGALGVFFPPDGALSEGMARENNLYRHSDLNKDPTVTGYLEDSRRIRTLKLRGEIGEGLWLPISSLDWWVGLRPEHCQVGNTIVDKDICEKYYTRATRNALANQGKGKARRTVPKFFQHFDTPKARYVLDNLFAQRESLVITEKLHGTSGRTGYHEVDIDLTWWQKAANVLLGPWAPYPTTSYKVVSGTRRTVMGDEHPDGYRLEIHKQFESDLATEQGLRKDETVYYEIVGPGIMANHSVPRDAIGKSLRKRYGDVVRYSYGENQGEWAVFVYRITLDGKDLPWDEVLERCYDLLLEPVPEVPFDGKLFDTVNKFRNWLNDYTHTCSNIDTTHPMEGVCIRAKNNRVYKYKSFDFCHLEGIKKNSEDYVDPEEIA